MTPFPLMNIDDILEITYGLGRHTNLYEKDMDFADAKWYHRRLAREFDDIKKAREAAIQKQRRR